MEEDCMENWGVKHLFDDRLTPDDAKQPIDQQPPTLNMDIACEIMNTVVIGDPREPEVVVADWPPTDHLEAHYLLRQH